MLVGSKTWKSGGDRISKPDVRPNLESGVVDVDGRTWRGWMVAHGREFAIAGSRSTDRHDASGSTGVDRHIAIDPLRLPVETKHPHAGAPRAPAQWYESGLHNKPFGRTRRNRAWKT